MESIQNIYQDPCQKIDPWCIDAYFDLHLNPDDLTHLILESSWGETEVDLTPAIKDGETITHLFLTDAALQYNREDYGREGVEDGGLDCIHGDDLSRIISMKYLKDVIQDPRPTTGDVYMYDAFLDLFKPFNLQDFVDHTNAEIEDLKERVSTWEERLANLTGVVNNNHIAINNALNEYKRVTDARLDIIEETIRRPDGIPTNTRIAWSNINYYADYTNSDNRNNGIFTHATSQTLTNDTKDA